ncbi:MAG: N-acetylglucosamine-6-phosphate deacetylase [Clostridia bacterium]
MQLIKNACVCLDGKMVQTDFTIENSRFKQISNNDALGLDYSGCNIFPALWDIHTHGAMGQDFNSADNFDKIKTILDFYLAHGVTSILATVMTDDDDIIKRQLSVVSESAKQNHIIKGIHLEGPFLSIVRRGAHPEKYLQQPSISKFIEYQNCANGMIKYVTLAPELPGSVELTKYLVAHNVSVTLGHSDASYDEAMLCVNAGAIGFTHTFNAMRPLEHHNPSIIATALSSSNYCEAILDGKHLHKNIIKMLYQIKGVDRLIGITDSLMPAGLINGEYSLAGTPIIVQDGDCFIKGTSTRAGSTLNAFQGVYNLAEFANIPLEKAIKCFSLTPATMLGLDKEFGSISEGKYADFIVVKNNELVATYLEGRLVYSK